MIALVRASVQLLTEHELPDRHDISLLDQFHLPCNPLQFPIDLPLAG